MGNEKALTEEIVELATQFGRYGYRRVTALLRQPERSTSSPGNRGRTAT